MKEKIYVFHALLIFSINCNCKTSFEQWQFFPCCHFLHKGDGAPWRRVNFIIIKGELLITIFTTFCLKSCLEIAVFESTKITFFTVSFSSGL